MKIGVTVAGIGNNVPRRGWRGFAIACCAKFKRGRVQGDGGRETVARDVIDGAGKRPPQPTR